MREFTPKKIEKDVFRISEWCLYLGMLPYPACSENHPGWLQMYKLARTSNDSIYLQFALASWLDRTPEIKRNGVIYLKNSICWCGISLWITPFPNTITPPTNLPTNTELQHPRSRMSYWQFLRLDSRCWSTQSAHPQGKPGNPETDRCWLRRR